MLSRLYPPAALENLLATSRVTEMQDGGMGGVRFIGPEPRLLGKPLAEAEYRDSDGIPVSIVINADKSGQLYELDFWKVDFSPLKVYPKPSELAIKTKTDGPDPS
jgi:hypothetical protein